MNAKNIMSFLNGNDRSTVTVTLAIRHHAKVPKVAITTQSTRTNRETRIALLHIVMNLMATDEPLANIACFWLR
jgi:hypothetical protein